MGPTITITSPFYFISLLLLYSVFIFIISRSIYQKKQIEITLFGAFCVLIYFLAKYFQFPVWTILIIPVVAVVLTAFEKKTQRFKFISSAILPLIMLVLTGFIFGGGQVLIFGNKLEQYYGSLAVNQDYFIVYLLMYPILIVSALFYSGVIRLVKRKEKKESKYIFFLWMPVTHVLLFLFFLIVVSQIPTEQVQITGWLIVAVIITTIFDLITYFVIDKIEMVELQNKKYEEEILKNKLDYQEAVLLNKNKAELRKTRHDMNNVLLTVKSLIQLENTEDAIALLNKATNDLSTVDGIPICSNSTLNALLSLKKQQCKKGGAVLNIHIQENALLHMDNYDICRISGNLIDNALEAVCKTENKAISFDIEIDDLSVKITTKNAFDVSGAKKKERRTNRGNGKSIIREITKKYQGDYTIYTEGDQYISVITLSNQNV